MLIGWPMALAFIAMLCRPVAGPLLGARPGGSGRAAVRPSGRGFWLVAAGAARLAGAEVRGAGATAPASCTDLGTAATGVAVSATVVSGSAGPDCAALAAGSTITGLGEALAEFPVSDRIELGRAKPFIKPFDDAGCADSVPIVRRFTTRSTPSVFWAAATAASIWLASDTLPSSQTVPDLAFTLTR